MKVFEGRGIFIEENGLLALQFLLGLNHIA